MSVPKSEARTLAVTAHLQSGVVLDTSPWPMPLDGVLVSAVRRDILGRSYGSIIDHHTIDLPLCRFRTGCGAQWVWAATAATPAGTPGLDVRYYHKRFAAQAAERVVDRLPANTDVGITKGWRIPLPVTVTPSLHWTVLGDPDRIRAILDNVVQLGKKRSQGEGLVVRWVIDDQGPADWDAVIEADGHPARPFPARAAPDLGFSAETTTHDAIRPPYWRRPLNTETGHREPRLVIAPWAVRSAA